MKERSATVDVINRQRRLRVDRKAIARLASWVLDREGSPGAEIGIILVGDRRIRELNRAYLGRDYPTDVLAFPQNEGEMRDLNRWLLGDVVVSTGRVEEQAGDYGEVPAAELARCLIHGILHLLGYRDHPPGDRRKLKNREEKLLASWKRKQGWSPIKS